MDWEGITDYERLRPFLERATHPRPEDRFADALAARQWLLNLQAELDNSGEVAGNPEPAPDVVAVRWATTVIGQVADDPMENFIGAWRSNQSVWQDQHD